MAGLAVAPCFLWECLTSPTVRPSPAPATVERQATMLRNRHAKNIVLQNSAFQTRLGWAGCVWCCVSVFLHVASRAIIAAHARERTESVSWRGAADGAAARQGAAQRDLPGIGGRAGPGHARRAIPSVGRPALRRDRGHGAANRAGRAGSPVATIMNRERTKGGHYGHRGAANSSRGWSSHHRLSRSAGA